jgi:hypothetical protein
MSIRVMAQVWEHEFSRSEQAIMLALADHAHDDGSRVFPSVERVAWKTGYSKRQTQRIIGTLRKSGVLVVVKKAYKNRPTEYRIDLLKAPEKPTYRGDTMSPQAVEGVTTSVNGGDISTARGDIAKSSKPSLEPSNKPKKKDAKKPRPRDLVFEALTVAAGYDIKNLTKSARGQLNKYAKDLREVNATPEQIARFPMWYRQHIIDQAPSVAGFSKYWPRYLKSVQPPELVDAPPLNGDVVLAPDNSADHNAMYENWTPVEEPVKGRRNGQRPMADAVADLVAHAKREGAKHESTSK